MTLENPIRAIREISHDITCRKKVRLANGREASALDIQNEYLTRAIRYAEQKGISPLEEQALGMWQHCLTALAKDPLSLNREVDWVIKYHLIEAYRAKHDLPLTHPKIALMDLQYHDVNRERGLFYRMQERGMVDRVVTDAEIDRAGPGGLEPPQTTRATPARRVHPQGQGAQARLHRRLGAPEAQRSGTAHRPLQGPVQGQGRTGGAADRVAVVPSFRSGTVTEDGRRKIVVSGVGAAGSAIIQLLQAQGAEHIVGVARSGAIHRGQTYTDEHRTWIAENTNEEGFSGTLHEALVGADVFIGVSGPNLFGADQVATMASGAIVLALANPDPEILPSEAAKHAAVVATGRSDFPNQINNVLAFPGLFRGLLDAAASDITTPMLVAAAEAIANCVSESELNAATSCRASSTLGSHLRSPRRSSSRPTPDRTTTTRDTP